MPISNLLNSRIKQLTTCFLLILSIWSSPSYSQDCLASTDARAFMSKHPDLQSEKLVANTGTYSAVLNNGDIVLAKFATCDLGFSAHYFSVDELSDNERIKRVKMFLSQTLTSEPIVKKVLPQLDALSGSSFKQAVRFDGLGDQHQIIIKASASPLYKLHIQYQWIPPEF